MALDCASTSIHCGARIPIGHHRPRSNPFVLLSVLLVLLGLAFGPTPCQGYTNLTIGLLLPTSASLNIISPNYVSTVGDLVTIVNFIAEAWNDRVAHPAGYHFNLAQYDSKFTRVGATTAALEANADGAVAYLGEYTSSNTIPAALAGGYLKTPQCSGAATSDDLSNKSDFPLFFRTIPPDSAQGKFIAQLCIHWGWTTVNLVASNEAYGLSISATFLEQAQLLGIKIARSYLLEITWQPADYSVIAAQLVTSNSRIVVALGGADYFYGIYNATQRAGFGRDWVWIGPDSVALLDSYLADAHLSPAQIELYTGILVAWPAEAAPGFAEYETMAASWTSVMGSTNTDFASTPYALFFGSCFQVVTTALMRIIARVGLPAVLAKSYSVTLDDYSIGVDTVSGHTSFDSSGNREGIFEVRNLVSGVMKTAYRSDASGDLTLISQPAFPDGSNTVPPWEPIYTVSVPRESNPFVATVLAASSLCIASVIGSWAYIVYHRNTRRVKHLGIPFTSVLCLGLVVSLLSPALMAGNPSQFKCAAQFWALVLGYSLSLSSLWIRSYRIFKVFDNRVLSKSQSLNMRSLVIRMLILPVSQVAILVLQQFVGPMVPSSLIFNNSQQYTCRDVTLTGGGRYLIVFAAGLDCALLAMLAYVSWKIRQVHTSFKDSVYVAYTMHHLVIAALVAFPLIILVGSGSVVMSFFIKSIAVIYSNLAIFVTMVARHVIVLPEKTHADAGQMVESEMDGDRYSVRGGTGTSTSAPPVTNHKPTIFSGVYAIKSSTGILRRWKNTEVVFYSTEGMIAFFKPTGTAPGMVFHLRRCILEADPIDSPGCIVLSHPGAMPVVIQFNSAADRQRWVQALTQSGALVRDATSGGSGASGGIGAGIISRTRSFSISKARKYSTGSQSKTNHVSGPRILATSAGGTAAYPVAAAPRGSSAMNSKPSTAFTLTEFGGE